ncbi:hypothetical protein LMG31884_46960 (plasmid) [Xanthomonas hydrangeae]|uniref:hypothetical protein n=1 Tax=Xanthomonas hydrangeae TaxID=2775159 RepID=UPI001962DA7B|nr:hypothetical protein LMG31884_46960 [Xanthomonas hydrangeae]CAD7740848.1 hypothetical protein LMG31884_46960 [Xanthomonas hydrangeae]CAD7747864.1 hypothetical protein LMG31887_46030 [Xanthomonas hydrangeae]CAD7747865.1 hypothetical protein LMG31887_46030 [Xanthomonas hydrangeae]CAD7748258.1 hypothetical protein LMG31885_45460 [Xanthomonas hydrangeae]
MLNVFVKGGFDIDFGLEYELACQRLNADAGLRFREYLEMRSVGADEQLIRQARQAYVESKTLLSRT